MMTCYLRGINKFLRCRTLCKSILKCESSTKGIELTRFVLVETISVGTARKFVKCKSNYVIRDFSVLDKLVRLRSCSQHRVTPLDGISQYSWKHSGSQGSLYFTTSRSDNF